MFFLVKVLVERSTPSLDRAFSYWCPIEWKPEKFTRVLVDFNRSKSVVGFIVEEPERIDEPLKEYEKGLEFSLSPILKILDQTPLLEGNIDLLAKAMKSYYRYPMISLYQAMLPPSYSPRKSSLSKPKEKYAAFALAHPCDPSLLSRNEAKLYSSLVAKGKAVASASTRRSPTYQSLLAKGIVEESIERVDRIKAPEKMDLSNVHLTGDQRKAKDLIEASQKRVSLLEGVTGSGKTMVYLKLVEGVLKKGGGAIVLVPEIALTDRAIRLFKTVFGDRVSLLHSSLPFAARLDEFSRIKEGRSDVVIGTRSALFAPVKNLSLIVLDEEQSSSYKQSSPPFYDARVVARMRSDIEGCKVVLSSATPLVEDRCRAEKEVYQKVSLPRKYGSAPAVKAEFVDLSDLSNVKPNTSAILSLPLLEAMEETFRKGEQSILLLNRRGFAPIVQCRSCHRVYECQSCEAPMVFHRRKGRLECHRCERSVPFPGLLCPYCNASSFETLGFGTERVEEILSSVFPSMRIARLDLDTARESTRGAILSGFEKGKYDVLLGTEMIAKGHDFPNVTLAAALSADQSLSIPSYLSNETTFDLISQLVGRSGRAGKKGRALIQTYNPLNKVLLFAARQDYEGFYRWELENRKRFVWPPYCFLIQVTVQGEKFDRVEKTAYAVKRYLGERLKSRRSDVFGPYDPFERKVDGRYSKRVLVKFKDPALVEETFDRIREVANPVYQDVSISIDRDPRGE